MKRKLSRPVFGASIETLEPRVVLAGNVVISEIMADNTSTLADQDRAFSDWIEILNDSDEVVDLDGWFLTDDNTNLAKWEFPQTVLSPQDRIVVFASEKDRATTGEQLHTNFKLAKGGEYLGLIKSDGTTIASEFDPEFPQQLPDVSYGISTFSEVSALVNKGDATKLLIPTDASVGIGWTAEAFDDASWTDAATGIGFAAAPQIPAFASQIFHDVQAEMFNQATSAYARILFNVEDVSVLDTVTLRMKYDDAFVAYLNGVEVARSNFTGAPTFDSTADTNRPDVEANTFQDFNISSDLGLLHDGENILAIHGINHSADSTGFLLLPELIASNVLSTSLAYMDDPTPGAANTAGFEGIGQTPIFSIESRSFVANFTLELTTAEPQGVIRFTINGSIPTDASPIYTTPLTISRTTQVRAITTRPSGPPSGIVSKTYVKLAQNVLDNSSDLPIILLDTLGRGAIGSNNSGNPEGRKNTFMAIIEPGDDGRARLSDPFTQTMRAGLKTRGSSTGGRPKASYNVEIWDQQNEDRDVSILGLPAESDWILYGPYNFDLALIRNAFIYELSNQIGRYATRSRFVEVYLSTNTSGQTSDAQYHGVYVFMEKIKRGPDRVDIERLDDTDIALPEISGGYILKIDRADPGDGGFSAAGQSIKYVYPKEEVIESAVRAPQRTFIRNQINQMGTALKSDDPVTGYESVIDVGSWIDHHILNVLPMNVDALRLSAYFYKPREGKIEFGPIWDFDRAIESTDGRDDNPRTWRGGGDATDFFRYPWWRDLFGHDDFWQAWIDRWQELREETFSNEHINSIIDGMGEELTESAERNIDRWNQRPRRRNNTSLDGTFQGEVNHMKDWLNTRADWIDSRFTDHPSLDRVGGEVDPGTEVRLFAGAGATIYFTTDGSDPRLRGGGISPTAQIYDGTPIRINANTRIVSRAKARALDGSDWSGPIAETFVVQTPSIVITELNYNPAPATVAEAAQLDLPAALVDNENFEFIEVMNVGTRPFNVNGMRFTNGVEFTFGDEELAPGERAVVVRDTTTFQVRYGDSIRVLGEYGDLDDATDKFKLSNAGEQVTLVGALEEPILDFAYDDGWYDLTDGDGFSLTIIDSSASAESWNEKLSWRPSDFLHGSPGGDDTGIAPNPGDIVINEILANTAGANGGQIELHNTTTGPIDISGWYLDEKVPSVGGFRLPNLAPIPGGGFLVLSEEQHFGGEFSLQNIGGDVVLQAAIADGSFTGFREEVSYFPSESETTQGRFDRSDGKSDIVLQTAATLGSENVGPVIGSVVINELMYNPGSGGDEFVEILNTSEASVDLSNWLLSEGVRFEFDGATIAAGESIIVVGVDPDFFRAKHGIDGSVQVLGPFTGKLANDGELVQLSRLASGNLVIPIDQIRYNDKQPWPVTPDGQGQSLSRVDATAYGNDPVNWLPGIPSGTPGSDNLFFDETPPNVPTLSEVIIAAGPLMELSWTASVDPESGLMMYVIYRDDAPIGTTDQTQYSDTSAIPGVTYEYAIAAVNGSSVESEKSLPKFARILDVLTATPNSDTQIRIAFSEVVDQSLSEDPNNYQVASGAITVVSAVREAGGSNVLLTTAETLVDGQPYRVVVSGLTGESGGTLIPGANAVFVPGVVSGGISGAYFNNIDLSGDPVLERTDASINFNWGSGTPDPSINADNFSARWTGSITAALGESYEFRVLADDSARLWVNEVLVLDTFANPGITRGTIDLSLFAGKPLPFLLEMAETTGNARMQLAWQPASSNLSIVPSSAYSTSTDLEADAPAVTAIQVSGSNWTPEFIAALGLGSGGVDVPLEPGAEPFSWPIDQVSITFDEDMKVETTDLIVPGHTVASVDFDFNTFTATWTLAEPVTLGDMQIQLSAGLTDLAGNAVSGDPNVGVVSIFAGDVDRSGAVDNDDLRDVMRNSFTRLGDASYSISHDLNGDGAVNFFDLIVARDSLGGALPAAAPAASPLSNSANQAAVDAALTLETIGDISNGEISEGGENVSGRVIQAVSRLTKATFTEATDEAMTDFRQSDRGGPLRSRLLRAVRTRTESDRVGSGRISDPIFG